MLVYYYEDNGRPGVPIWLSVGVIMLRRVFNQSDESVLDRWVGNPYWQYFCGEVYFRHAYPVTYDCTDYEFEWESADTNIVKVDHYDRITTVDVGNAAVYVSLGSIKKEIPVEVYEITLYEKLNALSGLESITLDVDSN